MSPLNNSSKNSTGYRNPRTHGLPWQISGSTVIRDNNSAFDTS
jgi:hypothetical protein